PFHILPFHPPDSDSSNAEQVSPHVQKAAPRFGGIFSSFLKPASSIAAGSFDRGRAAAFLECRKACLVTSWERFKRS
ncbi:MAG TPA: hypothetical protein VGR84_04495, partial [Candidatus Acidoferrales bacterium]|nr:hypothetical protein [Candidatus Acidoferrales bacterium]